MATRSAGKPTVSIADKDFGVDASIAILPAKAKPHTVVELEMMVRLLLLCATRTERRLVGLTIFQRRTMADAADVVGVAHGRARELVESVAQRAIQAERKVRSEERSVVIEQRKRRKNG